MLPWDLDIVVVPASVIHNTLSYFYGIHAFCSYDGRVYRRGSGVDKPSLQPHMQRSKGQGGCLDPDKPAPALIWD